MSKLQIIFFLLQIIKDILKDTDGDGRIDLFDKDPHDPSVK